MNKLIKYFLLSLCSILSFAQAENAIEAAVKRGALKIGTSPTYIPFEFTNNKGAVTGFEIDLAKEMAKALDVKLEIVSTDFDGLIPALLTEKFDILMAGMTITQKRNQQVNFANAFIEVGQNIILRKEIANEIKSYKDLNNEKFRLVSQIGTSGEMTIKRFLPKAKYVSYDDPQTALLDIINGQADALVYDSPFNEVALLKYSNDKLVYLDEKFTYEPLGWAVRKGDFDSVNWINNFLYQIKKDGTYDRIHHKWFKDNAWLKEIE